MIARNNTDEVAQKKQRSTRSKKTRSNTAHPQATSSFQLSVRPDNVGVITIDVAGEKINQLKAEFADEIIAVLQEVQKLAHLQGVVIISGKPDSFVAGADIKMIAACQTEQEAQMLAEKGQEIFAWIAAFSLPVVAAIHGACLGGGLELALACHARICSLDDKTVLGLPEVRLGLLPGSGGTQRLPRLIGVRQALDMMLTGKQISARQALKMGLIDDAVPYDILLDVAANQVREGWKQRLPLRWQERFFNSAGRALLFKLVHKKIRAKTQDHYPAPEQIIQVVRQGLEQGEASGYQAEAAAFGRLAMSAQAAALSGLFFASTALKKEQVTEASPAVIQHAAILGGGLMGAGIACVTAIKAGLPVRIKDINEKNLSQVLKYTWDVLSKQVKKKRIRAQERQRQMMLLSGTTDYSGFDKTDIVIEAVFEDLALKQQMVAEIEQHAAVHTIFASNTSSLPVSQIATGSQRPEQIIGLHYFSPADKMPLVEVIPHVKTSAQTIATTVAFARQQGKTAILVADKAGFYVNRILAPYINEAARCLMEAEPIEMVDKALSDFGFPVGPVTLLDEVGIDVATKIIPILVQAFGQRFALPVAFDAILKDGRKGRKNRRGFYIYPAVPHCRLCLFKKNKPKLPDPTIYSLLGVMPRAQMPLAVIAQRCIMMMLNEAARCLDEAIIRNPRDGDIGAVFGIGFPPFLGGPFRYIDSLGAEAVVSTLQSFVQQYGERFTPCDRLLSMAEKQTRFYAHAVMPDMTRKS